MTHDLLLDLAGSPMAEQQEKEQSVKEKRGEHYKKIYKKEELVSVHLRKGRIVLNQPIMSGCTCRACRPTPPTRCLGTSARRLTAEVERRRRAFSLLFPWARLSLRCR
ncbi:hypothetical protein NPIL_389711 [Nephila pilipes]|uniref:Uncharacterized protein n=1 Tax=Nephila pilipes TaxID=299642 RepID=A0A8X6QEP7_NEPPI|nr:hypothetical protein NPIL_389711 [Nephila pilipes]